MRCVGDRMLALGKNNEVQTKTVYPLKEQIAGHSGVSGPWRWPEGCCTVVFSSSGSQKTSEGS
eukprot:8077097-Lingulodinium_polyedra.AAC.1